MYEASRDTIPQLVFEHIMEALRFRDERLNAKTYELCEAIGPAIQRLLIRELTVGGCRPSIRVRLLQAIARTGPITDPDYWFDVLFMLAHDKHPQVKAEAMRFMDGMPERQSQQHHVMPSPASSPIP